MEYSGPSRFFIPWSDLVYFEKIIEWIDQSRFICIPPFRPYFYIVYGNKILL